MSKKVVQRGEIWYAHLPKKYGSSVQGGARPVLVYQTNRINERSSTVNVLAITSRLKRKDLGYHVELPWIAGLQKKSMVIAEQVFTLDQKSLFNKRCKVPDEVMKKVKRARRLVTADDEGKKQARHRRTKPRYSSKKIAKLRKSIEEGG